MTRGWQNFVSLVSLQGIVVFGGESPLHCLPQATLHLRLPSRFIDLCVTWAIIHRQLSSANILPQVCRLQSSHEGQRGFFPTERQGELY